MKNLHDRWPTSEDAIADIARQTDTVFLAFSAGKDSIAAWLALKPHFRRIIPIYKYLIPNLGFVEQSLRYYEEFFQTRVYRLPHPSLYRWLTNFMFQPPQHIGIIMAADLWTINHEELRDELAKDLGLPANHWIAVGTRACDSPQRRMAFNAHGPVNAKLGSFYPVYDWNKARLAQCLRTSGVKLPAEYRIFGRSFDGLDFRFLWGIREYWPDDYKRILEFFPMAELEIKRYEFHERRKARAKAAGPAVHAGQET